MRHLPALLALPIALLLAGPAPASESGASATGRDAPALLGAAPHPLRVAAGDLGAVKYDIDGAHSAVEFTIRFMGLTKVRGRFADFAGTIMFVESDPTKSSVSVIIETESIDTDQDFRDKHLRSPDFFDAESFPLITFQSARVEKTSGAYQVRGPLTIHGVTREVTIPFTLMHGRMKDGWDNERIGFLGELRINRKDFGVVGNNFWNKSIDLERMALADEVTIELAIEGVISNMELFTFDSREKPSIGEALMKTIAEKGIDVAVRQYAELKASQPDGYNFGASELNTLGYKLLQRKQVNEAIEVLELNVAAYPEQANSYDSLGEAYAVKGETRHAIENYRKALALEPRFTSAIEMLRWLEGKPTALTMKLS